MPNSKRYTIPERLLQQIWIQDTIRDFRRHSAAYKEEWLIWGSLAELN